MTCPSFARWGPAVVGALLVLMSLGGPSLARPVMAETERPRPAESAGSEAEVEGEDRESHHEREVFDLLTGGPVDAERYRKMWRAAQSLKSEPAPVSTNAVNGWQLVGPLYSVNPGGGYMTGRVRDIDAHNVRVLAASGGLWRFNFGAIAMSDSVPATWFGSFATSPSDPNTIFWALASSTTAPVCTRRPTAGRRGLTRR